jgi:hypothetical protein
MAEPRPYVVNAYVINLLNAAPVENMRPSLGSLIQRKTIDIGCYPFPFMTNGENIALDGRTLDNGSKLEVRPVPYWCSENTYAKVYGDSTYNNGKIIWGGKTGYIQSVVPNNPINENPIPFFGYDSALGVTFPLVRVNSAFLGLDKTVPLEWSQLRDTVFGAEDGIESVVFKDTDSVTLGIANNVLFKIWTGLTYGVNEVNIDGTIEYNFLRMTNFIDEGGTYSPLLDRYNYGCLDQVFNNPNFAIVGLDPNTFWEGYGASYGFDGGLSGERFLLNAITGGINSGSYFVQSPGISNDALVQEFLLKGISGGATLSGKDLALNLYGIALPDPFFGPRDPAGGFVDTMALLLGTNQKIVTLVTGGTASLRSLNFNNPCSASFVYREDSELGQWGYEVVKAPIGEDRFIPPEPPEIGCNLTTFTEFLESATPGGTAYSQGIVHPMSWMFWREVEADGSKTYREGFVHVEAGVDGDGLQVFDRLEGIHDHLCYEYWDGTGLKSRVYYPIRPITKDYHDVNILPRYNSDLEGYLDASAFGNTIDKKYDTAFPDAFKGEGSLAIDSVSLKGLVASGEIGFEGIGITKENGVVFPYFTPLASLGMRGIGSGVGDLQISGEFDNFEGLWTKEAFGVSQDSPIQKFYTYYAEGVSSGADFASATDSPLQRGTGQSVVADFRLYSWNALSKIKPTIFGTNSYLDSSFRYAANNHGSNLLGSAVYKSTASGATLSLTSSNVNVDNIAYPPFALPVSSERGLTFKPQSEVVPVGLDCGSYVNVIRFANNNSPTQGGLTATKTLISQISFGSNTDFNEFDSDGVVEGINNSFSFSRQGDQTEVPNVSTNFYAKTRIGTGNIFFVTPSEDTNFSLFNSSFYLSAEDYFLKYGAGTPVEGNWWEGINWTDTGENLQTIADSIYSALFSPGQNDLWSIPDWASIVDTQDPPQPIISSNILPFQNRFKQNGGYGDDPGWFDEVADIPFSNAPGGFLSALNAGVHPAFIYRFFTINHALFFGANANTIVGNCRDSWSHLGTPCHLLPQLSAFYSNSLFQNYKSAAGGTGCDDWGLFEQSETITPSNIGQDLFGKLTLKSPQGLLDTSAYVYASSQFDPHSTYPFQNATCAAFGGGGEEIADPPTNAALTDFGLVFAQCCDIIRSGSFQAEYNTNFPVGKLFVRDTLLAFTGSTAADANGFNSTNPTVSVWLQDKLQRMFDYYTDNRLSDNETIITNVGKIDSLFTTLYPTEFSQYKNSLSDTTLFRLYAIKPKCVGAWTEDCIDLANTIFGTSSFRSSSFAPSSQFFDDDAFNGEASAETRTITRPTLQSLSPTIGNVNTVLTSSDIIPVNEGFLGAVQTIYIEPLGKAENVLATEIQAVPRATIKSTVLGKITSIIDSSGFLRDVNVITFESGFGTKITGNSASNAITFSVEGLTLGSLADTAITGATGDDILVYDQELGRWVNRPFSEMIAIYGGGTADPNFFYQTTPPTSGITVGTRWMDSNTGIEYIYIYDGDTNQWIQAI